MYKKRYRKYVSRLTQFQSSECIRSRFEEVVLLPRVHVPTLPSCTAYVPTIPTCTTLQTTKRYGLCTYNTKLYSCKYLHYQAAFIGSLLCAGCGSRTSNSNNIRSVLDNTSPNLMPRITEQAIKSDS